MARLRMLFLVVLAVVALIAPAAVLAEQSKYEVKPGDTVWALSAEHLKDPLKWAEVVGRNPFLKEPGRLFIKGDRLIVLIKPGERLGGLLDITGEAPRLVPLSDLGVASPSPPPEQVAPEPNWPGALIIVLIILLIALAAVIVQGMKLGGRASAAEAKAARAETAAQTARNDLAAAEEVARAAAAPHPDPASAGPAVVEGGIRDDQPEIAVRRMAEVAQATQAMIAPGRALVPVPVGALERGLLTGRRPQGEPVRYRDGSVVRGVLNRESGFRQTFRFTQPDGTTIELPTYFLQRCGNDVIRTGGIPEEEVIFEPVATVASAPAEGDAATAVTPTLVELMEPQVLPAGEPVAVHTVPATIRVGLYRSGNGFVARVIEMSAGKSKSGASKRRHGRRPVAGAEASQQ